MYQKKGQQQQHSPEKFNLPFGGHLSPQNRWVLLSSLIPWEDFELQYAKQFEEETGAPAKPFRMALGALLIKEKLGISDRETIEQIKENPYLQYFIGMESYSNEEPFDASLLVHFRKRITAEMLYEINERIHALELKKNEQLLRRTKKKGKLH